MAGIIPAAAGNRKTDRFGPAAIARRSPLALGLVIQPDWGNQRNTSRRRLPKSCWFSQKSVTGWY